MCGDDARARVMLTRTDCAQWMRCDGTIHCSLPVMTCNDDARRTQCSVGAKGTKHRVDVRTLDAQC